MSFASFSSIAKSVGSNVASSFLGPDGKNAGGNELYNIQDGNWFRSLPYGFAFYNNEDRKKPDASPTSTIYLPISPSNINITTHFATNIVTTLYGVVEEHSPVRYFNITISGTTGIAPRYTEPFSGITSAAATSSGRQDFESATVSPLLGIVSSATNAFVNPGVGTILGLGTDIVSQAQVGNKNINGVGTKQSGYYAFHQLYQFFLKYKMDTSSGADAEKEPETVGSALSGWVNKGLSAAASYAKSTLGISDSASGAGILNHPIQFLNYKDGNKYDCVPISFTLTRSADNPMLYNYTIQLRAFNLRGVSTSPAPNSQLQKLGISSNFEFDSTFQSVASTVGGATSVISSFI